MMVLLFFPFPVPKRDFDSSNLLQRNNASIVQSSSIMFEYLFRRHGRRRKREVGKGKPRSDKRADREAMGPVSWSELLEGV